MRIIWVRSQRTREKSKWRSHTVSYSLSSILHARITLIFSKEQKMDLLRRLSRNPETAPVLSSANNFRRFSQNAMTNTGPLGRTRSADEDVEPSIGQPTRRKTEIGQVPPDIGPRSSISGPRRWSQVRPGQQQSQIGNGTSMEIVASIESNGKSLHRARKQSIKRQSITIGDRVRQTRLYRHGNTSILGTLCIDAM